MGDRCHRPVVGGDGEGRIQSPFQRRCGRQMQGVERPDVRPDVFGEAVYFPCDVQQADSVEQRGRLGRGNALAAQNPYDLGAQQA